MLSTIFLTKRNLYILLLIFTSYLLIGTGIHSDDILIIGGIQSHNFFDILFPPLDKIHVLIFGLPSYYLDYIQYYFFGYKGLLYDIVKVIITIISFLLINKFFSQYIEQSKSFILTFVFVFFITHDSINYWTIALPYLLCPAIIFYSHMLVNQKKYYKGFGFGILGSFMGFTSPPYVIGLSVIFLLKKEWKKFFFFITPQVLYILYYFLISKYLELSKGRIDDGINFNILIKQYIIQIGTFFDTFIGPSFWLKIYYSITQITLTSLAIGLILTVAFYKYFNLKKEKIDIHLLVALIFITLLAFGMFSLTGYYPQIAFNLGNRVTVYASLLVSFLIIVFLMNNKQISTLIFGVFLFSILGISDHWKEWNKNQLQVIENISKNEELKRFDTSNQLFLINNQYSKFGSISHIEFFTQPGVANSIFKLFTNRDFKVVSLNERFIYKDNKLIDRKYQIEFEIKNKIYVYDSNSDKLFTVEQNELDPFIKSLDKENRHWIQLLEKDSLIAQIIIKYIPRMEYIFDK